MLQAATGFGFSLVAAPLLFAAIGPGAGRRAAARARPRGQPPDARHRGPAAAAAAALDGRACSRAAAPGALAGVVVLRALPEAALQIAVTLGVAGTLAARRVTSAHVPAWVAGLAAGALTTSTSTNGPPMLLHLLGRGATPEQVRDTLTVCFIGLAGARRARRCPSRAHPRCRTPRSSPAWSPASSLAHLVGRRGFTRPCAGEHYEPVLTGVMLVAVVVGLIGALVDRYACAPEWRRRTETGSQPSTLRSWRRSGRTATCTSARC